MLIQFDCCECIIKQALRLARDVDASDEKRWQYFRETLAIFQQYNATATPPEMAAYYFDLFARKSGIEDGFTEIKDRSTSLALKLYDEMVQLCNDAGENEFITRLKLAISGNMIDYGVNPDFDLSKAETMIREVLTLPCDENAVADLEKRIRNAGKIVYILDNCGEAVLDRLLLETMKEKVTIAVRGKAIINDITRREVALSNLSEFPLIDTGCNAPGAPLKLVSDEFRQALDNADLVIAKGQGNFESLEGDFKSTPIYFLLRAKCPVIQKYLGVSFGTLQIIGKNLNG